MINSCLFEAIFPVRHAILVNGDCRALTGIME